MFSNKFQGKKTTFFTWNVSLKPSGCLTAEDLNYLINKLVEMKLQFVNWISDSHFRATNQ